LLSFPDYFAFHERVAAGLGRAGWAFPIDGGSAPLVTSRGCPFRCVHCSSNPGRAAGTPKTQRRHGRAYLGRLLDLLQARGVRRVHVLDELANVNEAHFDGLMAELAARSLRFEIPNGLRADYVLDRHLDAMAGRLTTLSVSAESGSERVVTRLVDKQLDLGAIERACAGARRRGVATLVHFLIGLPGESASEINETLAMAASLHERHGAWPSVQYATPLPGTRLAAEATGGGRRALPLVDDWGPRFQQIPTAAEGAVEPARLVAFRSAFDRRLAAGRAPRTLALQVTSRCNNRCAFCAAVTLPANDAHDERGLAARLVSERRRGARRLVLDGGEPTLEGW
ncbi:MAG: radical SAM protein, partial [Myxococcales bacterium]